jgi:NAD dependent epimerase/dehydratase
MAGNQDGSVLVTGADGFIGSHLAEMLVRQGRKVTALVQYNSFNSWGWLDASPLSDDMEVVAGDIRDPHFCQSLAARIDVIFHLAALIPIPYSYRAPDSYVDTNIKGTLNICQSALTHSVRKLIHTSTSEVYGTAQYVPMDEQHPLCAQSPYSATKIGADAIAVSFHRSFNLPVTIARPFNTFGPRQSARAVIPAIISQLLSGVEEIQLGDLAATRDFTFVEDTCRGFLAVADMDNSCGEVFHIGSNREVSVGDLVSLLSELVGVNAKAVLDPNRLRPDRSEVRRLRCDYKKLREATGFAPEVTLKEGLRRTVDWFRRPENLGRYKAGIYNV